MRRLLRGLAGLSILILAGEPVLAGKIPLRPEELLAESKLIVVGEVLSHRDVEQSHADGSRTKQVYLTIKVESVEKGEDVVKLGETIEVACWVVVKAPQQGVVWDSGHWGMPGEGGRAKFFLDGQSGEAWNVIYPNGFERLDGTPALSYPMEPADKPATTAWVLSITAGVIALVFIALIVWFVRSGMRIGKRPAP